MAFKEKEIYNDGTWFLSYLCEIGILENENEGTVEWGYATGILNEDFLGISKGYFINISTEEKDRFEVSYATKEEIELHDRTCEDEYKGWWVEAPKKQFTVNIREAIKLVEFH